MLWIIVLNNVRISNHVLRFKYYLNKLQSSEVLLTYLLTYLPTYLFTLWCRVLLEKLTGLQRVKKFPAFHGTRRFITSLTSVRHLSLAWASSIQAIYPHLTSWRSILILSTHLRLGLPSGPFPSGYLQRFKLRFVLTHLKSWSLFCLFIHLFWEENVSQQYSIS